MASLRFGKKEDAVLYLPTVKRVRTRFNVSTLQFEQCRLNPNKLNPWQKVRPREEMVEKLFSIVGTEIADALKTKLRQAD